MWKEELTRVSLQIPDSGQPQLPELEEMEGDIYTVPAIIRPVLSTYRLEVWLLLHEIRLLYILKSMYEIASHSGNTLSRDLVNFP